MVRAAGIFLAFFLVWLFLTGLTAPPSPLAVEPSPGPAVQIIPPPAERADPEPET